MKVLLIGNVGGKNTPRLAEEFRKKGHEFRAVSARDIMIGSSNGDFIIRDQHGEDLLGFTVFLFRGTPAYLSEEMGIIARELKNRGKLVIEPARAEMRAMTIDKLVFSQSPAFSVPNFSLYLDDESYGRQSEELKFPVIVKSVRGSMGRGVRKVDSQSELQEAVAELGFPLIVQEYLPITRDVRVLVLDGEVLGAFSRHNTPSDFLTTRKGGKREMVEVSEQMAVAALAATAASGLKFTGVDLLEHEGVLYVLEVNASPQFSAFEKITGVNVAARVVEYVEREYASQI